MIVSSFSPTRGSAVFWILLLLTAAGAVLLGRYPSPGFVSIGSLVTDPLARQVVLQLRLPRILTAVLLGMSLGSAGWVFQVIFRNPLVEPGFLGVTPGAALGAAVAIVFFSGSGPAVQIFSLALAFIGLAASFLLARRLPFGGWIVRLVIAGISVSALFTSGIGVLKYLADPARQLPELTFWMLGGLHGITWKKTVSLLPLVTASLGILFVFRWRLNVLSLDDRTAYSLGTRPALERLFLLGAASAAVAGVTAVSGIIGWVGLIVPHIVRRFSGGDSRFGLPGAMAVGGLAVLICDTVARAVTTSEIPLGILTSLFGAALFILLLSTGRVRISR